jgi:hypothetical protein
VLSRGRRFVEATDGGGAAQKLLRRRRWSWPCPRLRQMRRNGMAGTICSISSPFNRSPDPDTNSARRKFSSKFESGPRYFLSRRLLDNLLELKRTWCFLLFDSATIFQIVFQYLFLLWAY